MEKEIILLENLKDFKIEAKELNRNFVFIYDLFLQKKEEFELKRQKENTEL